MSLGVSSYPDDGQNVHEIIEACDKALLCAKKDGKNRTYYSKSKLVKF
ncbi:diguanylate cyclase domain-containing protein [Clostridium sp. DJ247]|nr:diguanylate cyclase [Clostridium sp. DJ247]